MNIFFILCQFSLLWLVIKKLLSLSTCSSSTSPSLTSLSTYSSASLSTSLSTITPIIITNFPPYLCPSHCSPQCLPPSSHPPMSQRWSWDEELNMQVIFKVECPVTTLLVWLWPLWILLSSQAGRGCSFTMVKLSVECSLLLKHGKGKIIATTPSPCSTLSSSTTSPSSAEKRKKEEEGEQGEKIEGSSCLSPTPGVGSWSSMLLPRQSHLLLQTRALVARKSWF